jgi:plastocyanin
MRPRTTGLALPLLLAAAAAAGAPAAAGASRRHVVRVTLREYAIVLPARLRPGPTTFVLRNRGRFPHNVTAVYGPVRFHSRDVPPGGSARLTVSLVPGAYLLACTVLDGGHLARGMFTLVTIGSREHGSATWHYP